ncbi:porin family protein [Galbibacter sp. EGI 63066]|uniref:porin family protein n=1 Tax=Galbibacter sp. EGI 63066 TaxID=2993559 RepID=UPI00224877C9|nr:porin family protein [Galbibacter sp. EGI 63066]MCX2678763.1 porin family protein [Galbibacter sp. EGI 63066]
MKNSIIFLLFFWVSLSWSQQDSLVVVEADTKYFDDQFYVGVNYNILTNSPSGVRQNGFSYGIMTGYIKDLPINKRRNVGFGLGAGLSFNAVYHDLLATKNSDGYIVYEKISGDVSYKRNKMAMSFLEFPIEFRWRSSRAEDYRFWRVYSGVRLSYLITGTSKFVSSDETIKFSNPDIRDFQYGIYFSFGYNTWNFYAQYNPKNMFEDEKYLIDGTPLESQSLKIGLIFYIL